MKKLIGKYYKKIRECGINRTDQCPIAKDYNNMHGFKLKCSVCSHIRVIEIWEYKLIFPKAE
jgi:hypothetical protein